MSLDYQNIYTVILLVPYCQPVCQNMSGRAFCHGFYLCGINKRWFMGFFLRIGVVARFWAGWHKVSESDSWHGKKLFSSFQKHLDWLFGLPEPLFQWILGLLLRVWSWLLISMQCQG
jgi:hypothetical protein